MVSQYLNDTFNGVDRNTFIRSLEGERVKIFTCSNYCF